MVEALLTAIAASSVRSLGPHFARLIVEDALPDRDLLSLGRRQGERKEHSQNEGSHRSLLGCFSSPHANVGLLESAGDNLFLIRLNLLLLLCHALFAPWRLVHDIGVTVPFRLLS